MCAYSRRSVASPKRFVFGASVFGRSSPKLPASSCPGPGLLLLLLQQLLLHLRLLQSHIILFLRLRLLLVVLVVLVIFVVRAGLPRKVAHSKRDQAVPDRPTDIIV